MSIRNNKKVIFGAISGIVASVTAGVLVKNSIDKKLKSEDNDLKEIANFKDIVKSYLKMERIAQNEAE